MNPQYFNQSLAKGLAILEFIAAHNGDVTLTVLANSLNMDKATAKRFVTTLTELGYISLRPHGKTFSITLKALQIGYSAICCLEWRDITKFYLEQLFADVRETISLSTLEGSEVLYVLRLNKAEFLPIDTRIGSRRPAYASSMGKMLLAMEAPAKACELIARMDFRAITPHTVRSSEALLAQVEQARSKGYALCDQEVSELNRSISAPIMGRNNKAVAAFAIAVRVEDYTLSELERQMAPKVLAYAAQISTALKQVEYGSAL